MKATPRTKTVKRASKRTRTGNWTRVLLPVGATAFAMGVTAVALLLVGRPSLHVEAVAPADRPRQDQAIQVQPADTLGPARQTQRFAQLPRVLATKPTARATEPRPTIERAAPASRTTEAATPATATATATPARPMASAEGVEEALVADGGMASIAETSAVTITGCLEADNDRFRLKDAAGADAPKTRSWKSGFLRKHSATIAVVDAENRVGLSNHLGQRVALTGTLSDREMQVRSLQRVAVSCTR